LIERYHYLGYKPLPGAQIRYLVFAGFQLLAALGFGAAAHRPDIVVVGLIVAVRVAIVEVHVPGVRTIVLSGRPIVIRLSFCPSTFSLHHFSLVSF